MCELASAALPPPWLCIKTPILISPLVAKHNSSSKQTCHSRPPLISASAVLLSKCFIALTASCINILNFSSSAVSVENRTVQLQKWQPSATSPGSPTAWLSRFNVTEKSEAAPELSRRDVWLGYFQKQDKDVHVTREYPTKHVKSARWNRWAFRWRALTA